MLEREIATDKLDIFGARGGSKDFASLPLPVDSVSVGRRLRDGVLHWGIHDHKTRDAQSMIRMQER